LRHWKNLGNRPVFDEVMPKILLVRFFPDTVYIVGSGSGISEDAYDYKNDYNGVTIKQNPCAHFRSSTAPSARAKAFQFINKRDKRAYHAFFHDKNATQHLHQNCLCTLTSSYRHLANIYTLLLNASIMLAWCGILLHIYLSVIRQ